ncbi:MAG: RNA polymerase sigma factor [Planctomycetota bacterium]|jgi:RNA polymerase sigma-70 factor (ECF subfamily)
MSVLPSIPRCDRPSDASERPERGPRLRLRGAASVHEGGDWSDEALMEAYVEGRRWALRTLIERYRDELLNFLTRFVGSRAAGEDVFQETFLQVHLSAETFDVTRRFKPWLFTIAANKARDHHRKHARRTVFSLDAELGDPGDRRRYSDLMECPMPAPDEPVLEDEARRRVRAAVDELPPHLREILLLAYFQRMSYQQVAEQLGIPLGTVKSRLHAAVGSFAAAWERLVGEEMDPDDAR